MYSLSYSKARFSILIGLALGLLVTTQVTLAQTPATATSTASTTPTLPVTNRQASSTERRETMAENRSERQDVHAARQAVLSAERQQRVLNLSANLSNRLEAAIARFYNIIARLEVRIGKLKAAGLDTTAAEAELRIASQHLASAKASLSTIDAQVQDATTSTEPQNRWITVRETFKSAGISIRASHQSLRTTVTLLKSAAVDTDRSQAEAIRSATSTATTTSE